MLAKEFEGIIKALPSFIQVVVKGRNPLRLKLQDGKAHEKEPERLSLKSVSEAVWTVVPFHTFALLPITSISEASIAAWIGTSLASLVLILWYGALIAVMPISGVLDTQIRIRFWCAAVLTAWFFTVLTATILIVIAGIRTGDLVPPDEILVEAIPFLVEGGTNLIRHLHVALFCATTGALVTAFLSRRPKTANCEKSAPGRELAFILILLFGCAAVLFLSFTVATLR